MSLVCSAAIQVKQNSVVGESYVHYNFFDHHFFFGFQCLAGFIPGFYSNMQHFVSVLKLAMNFEFNNKILVEGLKNIQRKSIQTFP